MTSVLQNSMEMVMSISRKESKLPMKRKRKKVDRFMFLPDDILLDILKRLPDDFPRYLAKYVCRRWFNIMTNRILLHDTSFIILQKTGNLTARHVGIREEEQGIHVMKVQDLDIPPIGIIRSWVNELLLISDYKKQSLYVYNLITKEGSYLPERNIASCGGYCTIKCGVALSFNLFKGIYKVVYLFMGPPIECHILILRRDIVSSKWKKIHVPCMNGGSFYSSNLVSIQGRYLHWDNCIDNSLVSMDMVKEEIVDMSVPNYDKGFGFVYTIFEMGGYLAFFAENSLDKADIWILKDFERKKWEKLQSITLKMWYYRRLSVSILHRWCYNRFPLCGVMSKRSRYIILECKSNNKGMCYYDLKNGAMKELDIHINVDDGCVVLSSPSIR
ncbi:unnamed protein product [Lactuca virosa]|uniref:F-box associated beta-propeller type 3 domain-containing protein n=1 Tax=Lactuca virosa TaxID=75947 RepID=A0AAU9LUR5_9ASTR|nr:unnamed protein product [Lactuca virosa]